MYGTHIYSNPELSKNGSVLTLNHDKFYTSNQDPEMHRLLKYNESE